MIKLGKDDDCKCLICCGASKETTTRTIKINRKVRNDENVISFSICKICFDTMKKEINELDYYKD